MRFEVNIRLSTTADFIDVQNAMIKRFSKIANDVKRMHFGAIAKGIETSFGSANRKDTTTLTIKSADGGYLVAAEVHYRPSLWFWFFFLVLLFSWVGWIIPIIFYLTQKASVRTAVQNALANLKNEFDQPAAAAVPATTATLTDAGQIEALAKLRDQGVLSEEEFTAKKRLILGLGPVS